MIAMLWYFAMTDVRQNVCASGQHRLCNVNESACEKVQVTLASRVVITLISEKMMMIDNRASRAHPLTTSMISVVWPHRQKWTLRERNPHTGAMFHPLNGFDDQK